MAPIKWIVLDRRGGYMLLISKCALDSKPYHEEWVDVTWETCTLRKWLNEGFLSKAFDAGERKVIGVYGTPVTKNTEYKTNPGNATKDRVFLLGIDEAKKYFINDNERKCKVTFRALVGIKKVYDKYGWKDFDKHFGKDPRCAWWLCSPRSISNRAALVSNYGNVFANCCDVDRGDVGVRPVLRLVI